MTQRLVPSFKTDLCMSSPDLFLQRITLIIMMAMSVMPATAAITIQRVLFFSPPAPAWAAAALVSVGAGELNPAEEENKELPYVRDSRVESWNSN